MAQLVFIAEDAIFAASFADIVRRELGHELLVNPSSGADLRLPKLVFSSGAPRRVSTMLQEVERALANTSSRVMAPDMVLEEQSRRLVNTASRQVAELTQKEQELLCYLHGKEDVARSELLQAVWGVSPDMDTHTLETHIYRLRQKWRDLAGVDCIVATETGYGWYAG